MEFFPYASITIINGLHEAGFRTTIALDTILHWLENKGFTKESDDGYVTTYSHPDYKNHSNKSIIMANNQGYILNVIYVKAH